MNKLALTIPQMDKLKRVGIDTSDASMRWGHVATTIDKTIFTIIPTIAVPEEIIPHTSPAYTLNDILNKLPTKLPEPLPKPLTMLHYYSGEWVIRYGEAVPYFTGDTAVDAAFEMLWFVARHYPTTIKQITSITPFQNGIDN